MKNEITCIKAEPGRELCILAHHYQSDEIIRHADILGDSLELARRIDGLEARHIIFCGVHFMAETAAILALSGQDVYIPDTSASCVMAEMVPAPLAEEVLLRLTANGARIIPLTYVNSSAAVKALCGRHGGSVCTSANAPVMLRWALEQGDGVLFLPDANLGRNTANILGLDESRIMRLDVRGGGQKVQPASTEHSLYLWPGLCAIHAKFHPEQIAQVRRAHPDARVLVHPECHPEVVNMADGAGSTTFLIRETEMAPAGSTLFIGTEWNLVNRLQARLPDKFIHPLRNALCSNMGRITEEKLLRLLRNLDRTPPVRVDENIAAPARLALDRMLRVCR